MAGFGGFFQCSSIFILALVYGFYSTVTACSDPVAMLPNVTSRYPGNLFLGGSVDVDDDLITAGWYRLSTDTDSSLILTDLTQGEIDYGMCGTLYPIYLHDPHPDVTSLKSTPVTVKACVFELNYTCAVSYEVNIRNCAGEIQYYLTQTRKYAGYCVGSARLQRTTTTAGTTLKVVSTTTANANSNETRTSTLRTDAYSTTPKTETDMPSSTKPPVSYNSTSTSFADNISTRHSGEGTSTNSSIEYDKTATPDAISNSILTDPTTEDDVTNVGGNVTHNPNNPKPSTETNEKGTDKNTIVIIATVSSLVILAVICAFVCLLRRHSVLKRYVTRLTSGISTNSANATDIQPITDSYDNNNGSDSIPTHSVLQSSDFISTTRSISSVHFSSDSDTLRAHVQVPSRDTLPGESSEDQIYHVIDTDDDVNLSSSDGYSTLNDWSRASNGAQENHGYTELNFHTSAFFASDDYENPV